MEDGKWIKGQILDDGSIINDMWDAIFNERFADREIFTKEDLEDCFLNGAGLMFNLIEEASKMPDKKASARIYMNLMRDVDAMNLKMAIIPDAYTKH